MSDSACGQPEPPRRVRRTVVARDIQLPHNYLVTPERNLRTSKKEGRLDLRTYQKRKLMGSSRTASASRRRPLTCT